MFTHLIESGSHGKDLARKGRFFLGTLSFYALLLMVAGVASIYAYNVQLDSQEMEVTLVTPIPMQQTEQRAAGRQPFRTSSVSTGSTGETTRTVIIADIDSPRIPTDISTRPGPPPSPPGSKSGGQDTGKGIFIGLPGNTSGTSGAATSKAVVVHPAPADDPLPPEPKPTPLIVKRPEKIRMSSTVINSKIIVKPAPAYPLIARQVRAQGTVTVEILIDEQGRVISAQATSGHPLLRAAAQGSAYQARFSPTSISGQPVKVSGVITYNFVLQ
jgi:protein TonB